MELNKMWRTKKMKKVMSVGGGERLGCVC
ncbi:hypothetical protein OIU76_016449, partial [Salix suchowensis]